MDGEKTRVPPLADLPREVLRPNLPTVREDNHALHQVAQLAHVPRPGVLHQHSHCFRRKSQEGAAVLRREVAHEPAHEEGDVVATLPQRGQIDVEDVEPVVQVGAEAPRFHMLAQRTVRGRDHSHVHFDGLHAAHARELALLQHPQELHLRGLRNLGDLVQKKRPAIGQLEPAEPTLGGAGKGALLVAKQLAFEQALRECANVDGDERPVAAGAEPRERARDELLAAAALPLDEHRAAHRRHLLYLHHDFAQRLALANQPGGLLKRMTLHESPHPQRELLHWRGLEQQLQVARGAQPLANCGVLGLHEANDRRAAPLQLAHEGDVRRIGEFTAHHHELRLGPTQLGANVVERTDDRGGDTLGLEPSVEPDGRLHVVQGDEDGHACCPRAGL